MPDQRPPRPDSGSGAGIAALIGAAVLIIVPITASEEGFVPKARPDPAHVPTVCYGETEHIDPARIYSRGECLELLRVRLARDYAPKVLACLPVLADSRRRDVFAALIDASYNAGPVVVCGSPMAAKIRAAGPLGDWTAACNALVGWFVTARDRKSGVRTTLPGLVKRRRDVERPLCLRAAVLAVVLAPAVIWLPPEAFPILSGAQPAGECDNEGTVEMNTRAIAISHNSVPAHVVHDFGAYEDRDDIPAGLIEFCDSYGGEKDVAILFGCPCGCGSLQAVNIQPMDNHPTWNWDDNREAPTLTPSILIHQLNDNCEKVGEHWHGYLTAGEFRSC